MPSDEGPARKALTKNPLGASGKAVAANVERLREEQNLTFAALSARLDELGRQIPPLGLRKIVAETRRVDADDLVALAVALRVSPVTLLMPDVDSVGPDDRVPIGADPSGQPVLIPARAVWDWLTGERPIVRTMGLLDFGSRAWPKWKRQEADRRLEEERRLAADETEQLLKDMGAIVDSDGDD